MTKRPDPIREFRDAFERMEPNTLARARWEELVGRATRQRGVSTREIRRWRIFGWSALAAAAALAVVLALEGPGTAGLLHDRPVAASSGSALNRDIAPDDEVPGHRDALAMAEVLRNDDSVRQLLRWKLPSPGEIDLGVESLLDDLAGAILRPMTRLSAQIEAGV